MNTVEIYALRVSHLFCVAQTPKGSPVEITYPILKQQDISLSFLSLHFPRPIFPLGKECKHLCFPDCAGPSTASSLRINRSFICQTYLFIYKMIHHVDVCQLYQCTLPSY